MRARRRRSNNNSSREHRQRRATREMCAVLPRLVAMRRAIAATVVSANAIVDRSRNVLQRVGATMETTTRAPILSAATYANPSVNVNANASVVVRLRPASPPLSPLLLRLASATRVTRATAALRRHRRAEGAMMHLNSSSNNSNSSVLVL
jgi:hypothetical protein